MNSYAGGDKKLPVQKLAKNPSINRVPVKIDSFGLAFGRKVETVVGIIKSLF